MNKVHFLVFITSFLFISCNKKESAIKEPIAAKTNTIAVLIDDQLWKGEIGDSIRNKFASPVIGLPEEEPLFNINQYPIKLLEGYMAKNRNSIVIEKGTNRLFKIQKNKFQTPQNAVYISGKSIQEIIDTLEVHSAEIIALMRQTELLEYQRINNDTLRNTQQISKKFRIKLNVPNGYQYVLQRSHFTWLKKEITGGSTSILIYQVPLTKMNSYANPSAINSIIRMRDSIGNLYLHGTARNSRMITEEAYSPYFSKVNFNGKKAFETKGTWEMENDFMSGPFINYCIFDYPRRRLLILEGFCYAPSKEKRDLMFELESIIKSVQFLKKRK